MCNQLHYSGGRFSIMSMSASSMSACSPPVMQPGQMGRPSEEHSHQVKSEDSCGGAWRRQRWQWVHFG